MKARRPSGLGWSIQPYQALMDNTLDAALFVHVLGIRVITAVEMVKPGKPEWHVSFSYNGTTAPEWVQRRVRADFGMGAAEEDNHGPGIARHLWLRMEPSACECAAEPATITKVEGSAEEGAEVIRRST